MTPTDATPPTEARRSPIQRTSIETCAAWVICLSVILGTLVRNLGRWHWCFELATHFVVQATVLAGVATLGLLVRRHWRLAGVAGLLTVANAAEWVPFYSLKSVTSFATDETTRLDVVSVNVYSGNRDAAELLRWLKQSQADVVFLSEVDFWWADQIADWKEEWPHQIVEPHSDNFGLALISRFPLVDSHLVQLEGLNPAVDCRIQPPGGDWTVVGLHPFPPVGRQYSDLRNQQLATAAKHLANLPKPRVVLGDLNSTSCSPVFEDFQKGTGLVDSRRGFGWQPTWPARRAVLRIPIDHCLTDPEVHVLDRYIGPDIGSDHLPVFARLVQ